MKSFGAARLGGPINGVPPRTAQAALRHSSLDLTMHSARERREQTSREATGRVLTCPGGQAGCDGEAAHNVYTDPTLLDVAGAIETLPELNTPGSASRSARQSAGV